MSPDSHTVTYVTEVGARNSICSPLMVPTGQPREEKDQEERQKVDDLRGSPLSVGTLEEMIDDNHAIVSSSVGPEYYVNVMSFVNQDLLEPGSSVLLHNKVR